MAKKQVAIGLMLAVLPYQAWCGEADDAVVEAVENGNQYFVSLRAGGSLIGNDDSAKLVGGQVVDTDDGGIGGFAGVDAGVYLHNSQNRVYYSYEYHKATTQFAGRDAYDTVSSLHLINADYLFRTEKSLQPFVGLHFGYAFSKTESDFPGEFDDNGLVFGLQTGIGWQVMRDLSFEVGLRHSVLPAERESWQAEDANGAPVEVHSQLKGITSAYAGVTYRF